MNNLIFYILQKYHGNWEQVYHAVCNKEAIDFKLARKQALDYSPVMFWITKEDYPNKLKDIYMPPFAMFYIGNKLMINEKVLGFIGKPNKKEFDSLKEINATYVLCLERQDISRDFWNFCLQNQLRVIVLFNKGLYTQKLLHYKEALFISEHWSELWINSEGQNLERLIYAFSDIIMVDSRSEMKINNLAINQENIIKPIYCPTRLKNSEIIYNNFNKNNLTFIKKYKQIIGIN
ncbi:hypothetical protein [Ureaplasma ceti]|uniref:Uncharacterized protein n=1 Tax=Ureaplasma ceti TaxID=3119530 RepID=A0ABP9U907_9BACT